jgi:glycosyltransferase involved in cell wall biosynthesis
VGTKLKEKPDIIIGSCVHPFAVLSAYILAKCKKSRFFFEVRDLWPQTLVDMGFLSEHSFIVWFLRRLEKFLYHKAEKIISLLPRAELYITKLGIPKEKIVWIPNGVDLSRYERVEKYDGGVSKPFTIMYLGAHGEANALNTVLDAAKILQNKGIDNLKFIFIGDGPEKRKLMGYVKNSGINNVEFYDTIPKDQLYKKIGTADAFIFCFKGLPLFKYGISPNKLFDYLASGRPILFSCSAEANNLVEEAKAGISVPPQDPEALANAVIELINLNPEKRIEMGENGLEYVKKYYDIRVLADKLEEILLQ